MEFMETTMEARELIEMADTSDRDKIEGLIEDNQRASYLVVCRSYVLIALQASWMTPSNIWSHKSTKEIGKMPKRLRFVCGIWMA